MRILWGWQMSEKTKHSYLKLTVKDSTTAIEGESTVVDMLAMIDALVNLVHTEAEIPVNEILQNFSAIEEAKQQTH